MAEVLELAGMWHMKEYIGMRQATITEYIPNRPIYELYTREEQMLGSIIFVWWWYQDLNP